jgi:hypothetical protein
MNLPRKSPGLLGLPLLVIASSVVAQTPGIISGSAIIGGRLPSVTNAPYSAVQETEHTQTLADGTHVVTKNHMRFYRDSAGRTRREMFFPEGIGIPHDGPSSIMIEDPVAGVIYNVQTQNHIAHLLEMGRSLQPPPSNITPNPTPPVRTAAESILPKAVTENLGTQIIDGVEADGRRTTRTIPTGARGNDGPIVMTSEIWYSKELRLTVLTKGSDPRSGETVTRITNLDRSEPDPALFQVPPDYTIIRATEN